MSIAGTVKYFLSHQKIDYHVLINPRVGTPLQTALSANIKPQQLAYAVLCKRQKQTFDCHSSVQPHPGH